MTTDEQARDALIRHLERSLRESRMLLRDQFAMASLQGALNGMVDNDQAYKYWARDAYNLADAMMKARME